MQKQKKGFTLIELLVVIAIIALLLSILMPALQKVKSQARRIICSTRIKSIHMAATLYAADDAKGTLPQGGGHRPMMDQDDAIGIDIDEFFKMAQYITDIPGLPADESVLSISPSDIAEWARRCANSKAGVVFVCPEMEKSPYEYMDFAFREMRTFKTVIYSPLTYVRLGYNYLAGFETEKWDWDSLSGRGNENINIRWHSPSTMSDSGNSVLVTDRANTHGVGLGMDVMHGRSGYEKITLDADYSLAGVSGFTVVGTLDGAIESKRISSLKLNPWYYWTDQGGFVVNGNGPYYSPF